MKTRLRNAFWILLVAGLVVLGFAIYAKCTEFKPQIHVLSQAELVEIEENQTVTTFHIAYKYTVNGTEYALKQTHVFQDEWFESIDEVKTELEKDIEKIYYDENDPAHALFESQLPSDDSHIGVFLLGGALLGLAVLVLILYGYCEGWFVNLIPAGKSLNRETKRRLLAILLLVVFCVSLITAVARLVEYISVRNDLPNTTALLVEYEAVDGEPGTYDLTYRYFVLSDTYYFEKRITNSEEEHRLGGYVDVFYDPKTPETILFREDLPDKQAIAFSFVLGFIFAGVSAVIFFVWGSASGVLASILAIAKDILAGLIPFAAGLGMIWLFTGNFDLLPLFEQIGAFILIPVVLIGYGVYRLLQTAWRAN